MRLPNGNTLRHVRVGKYRPYGDGPIVEERPDGTQVTQFFVDRAIGDFFPIYPLVRLGFTSDGSVHTLAHWLHCLKSPNHRVRAHAATQLGIYDLDAASFELLLNVARTDSDAGVRGCAVISLAGSPLQCQIHLPQLIALMGEPAWRFHPYLAIVVKAIGPETGIPALLKLWRRGQQDNDAISRANAAVFLSYAFLGESQQVNAVLKLALHDPDSLVRAKTAHALSWMAQCERKQTNTQFAHTRQFLDDFITLIMDSDDSVAEAGSYYLIMLGDTAESARPILLRVLRERPDTRRHALGPLCTLSKQDPETAAALLPLLDEKGDPDFVRAVVIALGIHGRHAKGAVTSLIGMLDNNYPGGARPVVESYRHSIIESLGKIGAEAKEAIPTLQACLKEPGCDPYLVNWAIGNIRAEVARAAKSAPEKP
jgi:HEAT repeat protein